MKLDRNINPDGKGKYALINLRTNQVQWGGDNQFFVIKYKDEFAAPALRAYAMAVLAKAAQFKSQGESHQAMELEEFGREMLKEASSAEQWPIKQIPN